MNQFEENYRRPNNGFLVLNNEVLVSSFTMQQQIQGNSKNTIPPTTKLSEQTLNKLSSLSKQLEKQLEGTQKSKYLKLADGQHVVIDINPDKIEYVTVTYPNTTEAVNRVQFMVKECMLDGTVLDGEEEKDFTTSITNARNILKWVMKGFTKISITRHGSDMHSTYYDIEPLL